MTHDETEYAIWLQVDAAYIYGQAANARDENTSVSNWLATQMQAAAENSARLAREAMGIHA